MECASKAVFIILETQAKLLLIAKVWVGTEVASYMHATRVCAIRKTTLEKLKSLHHALLYHASIPLHTGTVPTSLR